ncbi:MAG: adenylate/guanylate cyclase domain-containing protein [Desertifilum sp.]|nr:adenylate/guanylate cyclase domain-containing protein [Desertifilum sp.]
MSKQLRRLLWDWRGVWLATPAIAGLVLSVRLTGLLQSWEWAAYDLYVRLRPQQPRDERIAIVGIDEGDVRAQGQAIIPDAVYAQLIEKLKAQQPRVIGLDVYRDQAVEPGHAELVQVFANTPNLVGIRKVVGDRDRETIPGPPGLERVGSNDLIFDEDKTVRRGLLTLSDADDNVIPSFSFYLALLYLVQEGIAPQPVEGENYWKLGKTTFLPFDTNDGPYVRADAGGYQMILNYRGPNLHFETVSMRDVLNDRIPPDWGRDRIILIGAVGESFQDLFFTPYTRTPSERMAGVEVHANFASQFISAALEGRSTIRTWPNLYEELWVLFWSGVGATLTWTWRYAGGVKAISLRRTAIALLAGVILFGSTFAAFLASWWIPVIPPALALAGSAIAITAYIARTAGDIRKTFGRYLSDSVVANLLESPEGLKLGGQRQKLTILTSDLRGFTSLSERLPPEEVVKILNFYLEYMADVITAHQGTIDEFMGDGILVLFGAPTQGTDDAVRAVACGVAMQLAMISVNQKMAEWDLPPLAMGIGIHTGEVVVGNIGSEKRTKYGVVGNNVNLTYRIESYTTGGQILISESTLQEVGSSIRIDGYKQVQPKGVKQPILIYEVGGIGGEYNLFLPKEEEIFISLRSEIPLQYTILEGKHVGENVFNGRLVELSDKGALIRSSHAGLESLPLMLTNIKLNLGEEDNKSEDIYAKVLEQPAPSSSFYIRFTAKPPEIEKQLEQLYKSLQSPQSE